MKRCQNNFFAGANTGDNFVNFYDQIVDRHTCNAYFIIKGGSGMGKSTLLKKIASTFDNIDVDFFNCSSDTNSLDGLSLAGGRVSLVDGTCPHAIEPTYLGCNDFLIDMSPCLRSSASQIRPQLLELIALKKQHFDYAYHYLRLAKKSFVAAYDFFASCVDKSKIFKLCTELLPTSDLSISARSLFVGAYTQLGKTYLPATFHKKLYTLQGSQYANYYTLSVLAKLLDYSGIDCRKYFCPLSTAFVGALETASFCITTNPNWTSTDCEEITFTDSLTCDKQDFISSLDFNQHRLLEYATRELAKASNIHHEIEVLYRPHIDFDLVDKITLDTIQKVETYLQK